MEPANNDSPHLYGKWKERSRLFAWESANEDWYLFEDQHCHDTSYWLAVVSLEFSIQVVQVACAVDSGMGGGSYVVWLGQLGNYYLLNLRANSHCAIPPNDA